MRQTNQDWATFTFAIMIAIWFSVCGTASAEVSISEVTENSKRATVGILKPAIDQATISGSTPISVRGTGIHMGKGYILTARHAIEREAGGKRVAAETIQVITSDLHQVTAKFIGRNTFLDIALYHIPENIQPASLAIATFAQQPPLAGEEVFTVGYPLGWGPAMSFGRVGNPNTFLQTVQSRLIQVDLSACSGNSGGGLFNPRGEVVGIVHAIIQTESIQGERRCSRFAFSVPGSLVQKVVRSLIDGTRIHFSKLGLNLSAVKQNNRWAIAVKRATGPARQAGFKKGDVVLAIDHQPVHTAAQLKNYLIEHTEPGQEVSIHIHRNQQPRTLRVILGRF